MTFQLLVDIFLHLDKHLNALVSQYNVLAYAALFLVIFVETGVVIMPFLPGDSLIFAVGALCAAGGPIDIPLMLGLLYIAAVGGDSLNYEIGRLLRRKVEQREKIRFIKAEYIARTQEFFARHGGKAVTIARFIPIIRTFAPFVAGVGNMRYRWFLGYNVLGGTLWVTLFFCFGYFFGNIGYIKEHFSIVVLAIVFISAIPAAAAFLSERAKAKKAQE